MEYLGSWFLMAPLVVGGLFIVVVLFRWLWNSTLPDLFNVKQITFFQAVKIILLSLLLTGGGTSLLSFSTSEKFTVDGKTIEKTTKFGFP